MTKEERVREILARLDAEYGTDLACYLTHEDAWQLLVATILSAQCTDARVNEVTPGLFAKYDSVEKFAEAELSELEQDIPYVYEVLRKGSEVARAAAAETLADVKRSMRINYFDQGVLEALIEEQKAKYSL